MEWLIKQGNTNIQDILIRDRDENIVENLSDAQYIKLHVKEQKTDTTPKISKSKGDGIEVLSGEDLGKIRVTILPDDTKDLVCKTYYVGIEIKFDEDTIYEINLKMKDKLVERFMIVPDIVN